MNVAKRVEYPGKVLAKVIRVDGEKINVKLITLNFKRYILYLGTQPKHEGGCGLQALRCKFWLKEKACVGPGIM